MTTLPGSADAGASTPHILIVDDEVAQMKALCQTLADCGYRPHGCSDPNAALAALRETDFDLLLSDLMMPGIDGIELLKAAQALRPDLVGIIMTGEGTISTAVEAMKAGALDYILKPFKLSAIVPVLSRALAVRRLRQQNTELARRLKAHAERLEIVNGELEAFTYSVSHDLRAPLRAVFAYASILLEDHGPALPAGARELAGKVLGNAKRMELLIDGLLELSRAGRATLTRQVVDMAALAGEVSKEIAEQTGKSFEVRIASLPAASGDPRLLRQVFANLLSNAVKFSAHREKPLVEVDYERVDGECVYLVRDNGAGFDMRYADRLFGAFQRLHSAAEFEGTGIGLSTVRRIVQRHGGRIWAEAKVEEGATFRFTLPPQDETADAAGSG